MHPALTSFDSLFGSGHLDYAWFLLILCCQVKFSIEIQMTSISIIILWHFIVLSILLDNSTNYASDLGKNR